MKVITTWFKGIGIHDNMEGTGRTPWIEGPSYEAACLWLACTSMAEVDALAQIVGALFPERACDCPYPESRLIHFNNHPDTTRDQIDKIMHAYEMEYGE